MAIDIFIYCQLLAIFAGYTVKLRERQFVLEKRNGKELKAIAELKQEIEKLKKVHESKNAK